jgi:hypothetical protein
VIQFKRGVLAVIELGKVGAREATPKDLAEVLIAMGTRMRAEVIGEIATSGDSLTRGAVQNVSEFLNAKDALKAASERIEQLETITNNFTDTIDPEWFEELERLRELGRTVEADELDEDPPLGASFLRSLDGLDPGAYAVLKKAEFEELKEAERQGIAMKTHHLDLKQLVAQERHAARCMAHAAIQVLSNYLIRRGIGIGQSPECTALNDAIHDWLDTTPNDEAKTATQEFIERWLADRQAARMRGRRADTVIVDDPLIRQTVDGQRVRMKQPEPKFGDHVAAGALWLLDRLWPRN